MHSRDHLSVPWLFKFLVTSGTSSAVESAKSARRLFRVPLVDGLKPKV